jgi:hypothetical protein
MAGMFPQPMLPVCLPCSLPDAVTVQEMLFFQSQTVQVIMRKVAAALKEVGSDADPTEYFHFTFPAQRVEDPGTK